MKKTAKSTFYNGIFYLENLTLKQALSLLSNSGIPCLVSPVHSMDFYSEQDKEDWESSHDSETFPHSVGELKKAHVHVIFKLPFPKNISSALLFINSCLSENLQFSYIQPVGSLALVCRYLIHLDNPEKFQYDFSEIKNLNFFPADFNLPKAGTSSNSSLNLILDFINKNQKATYFQLVSYFASNSDVSSYIESHSYHVHSLLKFY